MNLQIPDNIQVLLDCLQSREDLQLEEMRPLQEWIDQTPGGELAVAQAFAKNAQLEAALEEIEIRVPKTLERQVSTYVNQNVESEEVKPAPRVEKARPSARMFSSRSRFVAGVFSAVAAIVLVGASIVYFNGLYQDLDANVLAEASINWTDQLDDRQLWEAPGGRQYLLPQEMVARNPNAVAEFYSEYGDTSAYQFMSQHGDRAILFVFKSEKEFDFRHIGLEPDVELERGVVGVGKDGDQVRVLLVRGQTVSGFRRFIRGDFRRGFAFLLRVVWILC